MNGLKQSPARAALALSIATALTLTACGGGGGSSSGAPAPAPGPAPAPAPALLIGMERAVTGTGSSATGFARLNLYNADGTNGAPLFAFNIGQPWDWTTVSTGNMNPAAGIYSDERLARVWTINNGEISLADVSQRNQPPRRVTNTNFSATTLDFCSIWAAGSTDVSFADTNHLVLRRAGVDQRCDSADDRLVLVRASQRADEPGVQAPAMAGPYTLWPLFGKRSRANLVGWAIWEQSGAIRVWRPDLSAPTANISSELPAGTSPVLFSTRSLGSAGASYLAAQSGNVMATRVWRLDTDAVVAGAMNAAVELTVPALVDMVQADVGGVLLRGGGRWFRIDDNLNTVVQLDTTAMGTVRFTVPADEGVYVVGQTPDGAQSVYLINRSTAQATYLFGVAGGGGDSIATVIPQRGRVLVRVFNSTRQNGLLTILDSGGRVIQEFSDVTTSLALSNPSFDYGTVLNADRVLLSFNVAGRNAGGSVLQILDGRTGSTMPLGVLPMTVRDVDLVSTLGARTGNRILRARKTNTAAGTVAEDGFFFDPTIPNSLRRLTNNINF